MHIQPITTQQNNKSKSFGFISNKDVTFNNANQLIEHQKEKIHNFNYASAIAITSIAIVCSAFMLSKGTQKGTGKYLQKAKKYFEKKYAYSLLNENGNKSKFYKFSLYNINHFIKRLDSINNITSLKDILFMKFMYKTKLTKTIHNNITNYFEKISRKTVLDSFKQTDKAFTKMNELYEKLDKRILEKNPDEIIEHKGIKYTRRKLVELAKENRLNAHSELKKLISEDCSKKRYEYINKSTSTLYTKFWDASFKDFWTKNNKFKRKEMWQTFIAAEQIKGEKTNLAKEIADIRNSITYTKDDRCIYINNYIKKLKDIIPAYDEKGHELIKRLEWISEHSEGFKYNNNGFLKELLNLEKHSIPIKTDENLVKTIEEHKKTYIDILRDKIDYKGRGKLQEMMALYYKASPYELTKSGAVLATENAIKSLDKSVNLESVEFFDKIRDLRLGSAPTDVLTILLSFFALSYGLGYAKDKDERISIILESGIPIAGAIATTMYTAAKLVSGGKSLALGFLSGIALNQIGKFTNNFYKEHVNILPNKNDNDLSNTQK